MQPVEQRCFAEKPGVGVLRRMVVGVDEAGEEEAIAVYLDGLGVLPFWFLALDVRDGLDVFFDEGNCACFVHADCAVLTDFKFGERLAVYEGTEIDCFRNWR